jgi:hypothetical protein
MYRYLSNAKSSAFAIANDIEKSVTSSENDHYSGVAGSLVVRALN